MKQSEMMRRVIGASGDRGENTVDIEVA